MYCFISHFKHSTVSICWCKAKERIKILDFITWVAVGHKWNKIQYFDSLFSFTSTYWHYLLFWPSVHQHILCIVFQYCDLVNKVLFHVWLRQPIILKLRIKLVLSHSVYIERRPCLIVKWSETSSVICEVISSESVIRPPWQSVTRCF